jgi:hypothetical protein
MAGIHFGLCLYELIGKGTVTGKIISYKNWTTEHSGGRTNRWTVQSSKVKVHHSAPIALYTVENIEYQLQGPEVIDQNAPKEIGSQVPILYSKRSPAFAYFYTLTGFWFSNYIYWFIAILVVIIALTTFMEQSQLLIFRYSRSVEGLVFELTPSEKPNWIKRNVGKVKLHYRDEIAKRQSLRRRRH